MIHKIRVTKDTYVLNQIDRQEAQMQYDAKKIASYNNHIMLTLLITTVITAIIFWL